MNYQKLAEQCDLKNATSASTIWCNLKKKLVAAGNAAAGESTPADAKKSTPKKRAANGEAGTTGETPKKRARKGKATKDPDAVGTTIEGAADDEDVKVHIKVKEEDEDDGGLLEGAQEFLGPADTTET